MLRKLSFCLILGAEPEFFHSLHYMKYIAGRDKTKEDPEFEFL